MAIFKSPVLYIIVGLCGITLATILILLLVHGSFDAQSLISSIIAVVGPVVTVLIALMRLENLKDTTTDTEAAEILQQQVHDRDIIIAFLREGKAAAPSTLPTAPTIPTILRKQPPSKGST